MRSRSRSQSRLPRLSIQAIVSTALLIAGCAHTGGRPPPAPDGEFEHTQRLLVASGDADSLAAAALLSLGPAAAMKRVTLMGQAVSKAPDRPYLVWMYLRLCSQADACDAAPIEAQLRALDPANGAGWVDAIARAAEHHDTVALQDGLAAIAAAGRFDSYWNRVVVHLTDAVLKTRSLKLPVALMMVMGAAGGSNLPPFQAISNACKGDALRDPESLQVCRRISGVLRGGDTYVSEAIGIAIARRAWPQDSAEYADASSARRIAHYRVSAQAKLGMGGIFYSRWAAKRLQLLTEKSTEQEVVLAELVDARLNPDPPAGYAD